MPAGQIHRETTRASSGQSSTITYLVDGVAVPQIDQLCHPVAFSTAGLSVGTHTLQVVYSGNKVYASNTYTHHVHRRSAADRDALQLRRRSPAWAPHTSTLNATANVTANPVPSSVPSGTSVPIDNLSVTVDLGPGLGWCRPAIVQRSTRIAHFDFSYGGHPQLRQ